MDEQIQTFIATAATNTSAIARSVQDIDRELESADGLADEAKERIRNSLEAILRAAV